MNQAPRLYAAHDNAIARRYQSGHDNHEQGSRLIDDVFEGNARLLVVQKFVDRLTSFLSRPLEQQYMPASDDQDFQEWINDELLLLILSKRIHEHALLKYEQDFVHNIVSVDGLDWYYSVLVYLALRFAGDIIIDYDDDAIDALTKRTLQSTVAKVNALCGDNIKIIPLSQY